MTSQLTIDLKSVSYCKFFYRNQFGEVVRVLPKKPSVHGVVVRDGYAFPYDSAYPKETLLERGYRLGLIDSWVPVCIYQFRNNHSMRFEKQKAKDMRDAYNAHIFK